MNKEDNITKHFLSVRQRLWLTAKRMLGTSTDADDALQDFFVKLWSRRELHTDTVNDKTMAVMMRNQCIDTLRRKSAKGYDVDIDEMRDIAIDEASDGTDVLYDDVQQIINDNLTDLQRTILSLHDMYELEYPQIARQLNMTETAVRANVSCARNTIRKIYRERSLSNDL